MFRSPSLSCLLLFLVYGMAVAQKTSGLTSTKITTQPDVEDSLVATSSAFGALFTISKSFPGIWGFPNGIGGRMYL